MAYRIEYSRDAIDHLRGLTSRQRRIVFDAVDRQLQQVPDLETRRRKPMRPNPLAPWELRAGDLRVYYEIETGQPDSDPSVVIRAVGIKKRNAVWIGGDEVRL